MRRSTADADAPPSVWVDPRGLRKPPKGDAEASSSSSSSPLSLLLFRALAVLALLYAAASIIAPSLSVLDLVLSVRCSPDTFVVAGTDVTCEIRGGAERITQAGVAGKISLLKEAASDSVYQVTFATKAAGRAGVQVTGAYVSRTRWVDVKPGPAASVAVACAPARVAPGAEVRCAVTTRDRLGNLAEVERPAGATSSYFSVSRLGSARALAVHETDVSFVAGETRGRAGVAVALDGQRVEGVVEVV